MGLTSMSTPTRLSFHSVMDKTACLNRCWKGGAEREAIEKGGGFGDRFRRDVAVEPRIFTFVRFIYACVCWDLGYW